MSTPPALPASGLIRSRQPGDNVSTSYLVPTVWIEDDVVVIHDRLDRSPGRIPLADVEAAWKRANAKDSGFVTVYPELMYATGRRYHRDTLRAALDLVENLPPCQNDGCDSPFGSCDMGDGVRFCAGCRSSAGGRYADREAL